MDGQTGLDYFVFAYLGVHQAYYARGHFPAFGVFVRRTSETESFPYCNATIRDLHSPFVSENASLLEECFLLAEDARLLAAHDVTRNHAGDVWHYLGSMEYLECPRYCREHWQWLYEFHYRERVPVDSFDAVLWPEEKIALATRRGWDIRGHLSDNMRQFKKEHPDCSVVPYEVRRQGKRRSFTVAAAASLKFLLEEGRYPTSIDVQGVAIP